MSLYPSSMLCIFSSTIHTKHSYSSFSFIFEGTTNRVLLWLPDFYYFLRHNARKILHRNNFIQLWDITLSKILITTGSLFWTLFLKSPTCCHVALVCSLLSESLTFLLPSLNLKIPANLLWRAPSYLKLFPSDNAKGMWNSIHKIVFFLLRVPTTHKIQKLLRVKNNITVEKMHYKY